MTNQLEGYRLSRLADNDLIDIITYTKQKFGSNQTKKYLLEINSVVESLINNPYLGKRRLDILPDIYTFPVGAHLIFYKLDDKQLLIVRILHESRDYQKYF